MEQYAINYAEGVTLLDDVDFSYVNNIEVIKGPASTLYGGGIGGTVKFYTRPSLDRKSTRLNSSHLKLSRMPSSA